jgi:predicted dehydrogenase
VSRLRAGVIGVGALGQHHARVYATLPEVELMGVVDRQPERAAAIAAQHATRVFESAEALASAVDLVSVAVPTADHHAVARPLLAAGKSVLVEKPMTTTLPEADDLIAAAAESGAVLQVGHVERFNPALDLVRSVAKKPRFIEVHRLGSFSPRSLDIDVVLDLMIHDLDIVLAIDGSPAVQVDAVGVPVLTPKVDIANARLRFASGLIANVTASRVSAERVRKFRVFAEHLYVSADFAARAAQVYRIVPGEGGAPQIAMDRTSAPDVEPLQRQLAAFVQAVRDRTPPVVSGADGRRALALAHEIIGRMAAT